MVQGELVILLAQESEIAASLEYPASIIGALIGSRGAKINEDRRGSATDRGSMGDCEACGGVPSHWGTHKSSKSM